MNRSEKFRTAAVIVLIVAFFVLFYLILGGVLYDWHAPKTSTPPNRTGVTRALPESGAFIGSAETKKFHFFYCSYLPDAENQVPFDTREEALAAGYTPCGHCKP